MQRRSIAKSIVYLWVFKGMSMLFFFEGSSLQSGIYEIRNRFSNRSYIGQAKEFKSRWLRGYRASLRSGKCHNAYLQADYDKCKAILGHDDFLEFHIIEEMANSNKFDRVTREQEWLQIALQIYGKKHVYNFKENLLSGKEGHWSDLPENSAIRKKLSIASTSLWKNASYRTKVIAAHVGKSVSLETKLKMSESHKGEKAPWFGKKLSEKHRQKLSEAHKNQDNSNLKKELVLVGPDGTEHHVCGISKFIKEQHLSSGNMFKLFRGQLNEYKGWRLVG